MDNYPLISHGCWDEGSGGYTEFMQWRALLARAAGIGTEHVMLGEFSREVPKLDYDSLTLNEVLGTWDRTPDDWILVILAHTDEEGAISPEDAKRLCERMEELMPALVVASHHAPGSVLQKSEQYRTEQFMSGLKKAHETGDFITFE